MGPPLPEPLVDVAARAIVFVRPGVGGHKLGRGLAEAVVAQAQYIGYNAMRLDTFPAMAAATVLYESMGFGPISPYYDNPLPDARYFERDLETPQ